MQYLRLSNYIIHFENNKNRVKFTVLPIVEYEDLDEFAYIGKDDEHLSIYNEEKCVIKFYGYFEDRGIIDSKVYFPDEEYLGRDLEIMSSIYTKHIIPWCETYLKKQSPN